MFEIYCLMSLQEDVSTTSMSDVDIGPTEAALPDTTKRKRKSFALSSRKGTAAKKKARYSMVRQSLF